jgi:hypothetical protein
MVLTDVECSSLNWHLYISFLIKKSNASKPTAYQEDEESTQKELEEIHMAVEPPMGEEIPIHINPKLMVNDEPPEEGEVKEAVRKLNVGKAAGATRIMR